MLTAPQIIDILLLTVIALAGIKAFRSGLATALVDLVGNIAGLIAAWVLSNKWAPIVYERYFRDNIVEKTYQYLKDSTNTMDVQGMLSEFTGKLPLEFLQEYVTKAEEVLIQAAAPSPEIAEAIADGILAPIITVVVGVVIFAITCGMCSIVASLLSKAFKAINHIPVLGFANRLGGLGIGVATGFVYVILISCILSIIAIITENTLTFLNIEVLSQSKILSLTGAFNPFMK